MTFYQNNLLFCYLLILSPSDLYFIFSQLLAGLTAGEAEWTRHTGLLWEPGLGAARNHLAVERVTMVRGKLRYLKCDECAVTRRYFDYQILRRIRQWGYSLGSD